MNSQGLAFAKGISKPLAFFASGGFIYIYTIQTIHRKKSITPEANLVDIQDSRALDNRDSSSKSLDSLDIRIVSMISSTYGLVVWRFQEIGMDSETDS